MGFYVNPPGEKKEDFLLREGLPLALDEVNFAEILSAKMLPVVWVNNGAFTAVGIAYSEAELREFLNPDDRRQKKAYAVDVKTLMEVTGSDFHSYVRQNMRNLLL